MSPPTVIQGGSAARRAPWGTAFLIAAAAVGVAAAAALQPLATVAVAVIAVAGATLAIFPLPVVLSVLILAVPFRFYFTLPGTTAEVSAMTLLVVGLAAVWLARMLLGGALRLRRWEWIIAGSWIWIGLSVFWSIQPAATVRGIVQWDQIGAAMLLSACAVLRSVDPALAARRLLRSLLVLIALWSIVGFIETAVGLSPVLRFLDSPVAATLFPLRFLEGKLAAMNFNWRDGDDVQPFGPFLNSIEFGIFTAVGLSIVAATFIGRARLVRLPVALGMGALFTVANVMALKATGWSAAAVAIAFAFITFGRSVGRVLAAALGTLLVIGVVVFALRDVLIRRLEALAIREGAGGATTQALSRPATWAAYAGTAVARPITGFGSFTANSKGPIRWTRVPGSDRMVAYQIPTENGYLTALIETGFVGLAGILVTFGGAVIRGARLCRRYPASKLAQATGLAAVGLGAIMTGSMTVDGFSGDVIGFIGGALVGIVIAAARLVPVSRETA